MKSLLKFSVVSALMILAASCSDKDQFEGPDGPDAVNTRATVNLGLPGGTDAVDAEGNVTVSRDVHLTAANTYILHNYFRIQDGYTITIDAGTVIKGDTTSIAPGTLVIERGAQIQAVGTCNNPIVFTSNYGTPAPGDWGGVVLLGKADVNLSGTRGAQPSGTDGLGFIEGLPTPNNTGRYGNGDLPTGSYNSDNSGTMQYVRIEYGGHVIGTDNELNGLTMGGVGNGTTLDHIMVKAGKDDAFEFFGGCVNAKYLIASENRDDDFDTDQGYSGKIQFGISRKTPDQDISSFPINGFESNGDSDDDYGNNPLTDGTFSNFTVIGPIYTSSTSVLANYNSGALIRDDSHLNIFNSIITGYPNYQVELETPGDFDSDENDATDNLVSIEGVTLVYPTFNGFTAQCTNISGFGTHPSYHNECLNASASGIGRRSLPAQTGLSSNAWSTSSPSFVASAEKSAYFSHSLFDNAEDNSQWTDWDVVDFRGAFGNSSETNNANWCIDGNWVAW